MNPRIDELDRMIDALTAGEALTVDEGADPELASLVATVRELRRLPAADWPEPDFAALADRVARELQRGQHDMLGLDEVGLGATRSANGHRPEAVLDRHEGLPRQSEPRAGQRWFRTGLEMAAAGLVLVLVTSLLVAVFGTRGGSREPGIAGQGASATPLIVLSDDQGHVLAIDPVSQREVYSVDIGPPAMLLADGDRLYVAGGGSLRALDAATGDEYWRVPLQHMVEYKSSGVTTSLGVSPDHRSVYVYSHGLGSGPDGPNLGSITLFWVQIFDAATGEKVGDAAAPALHVTTGNGLNLYTPCSGRVFASPDNATLYFPCVGGTSIRMADPKTSQMLTDRTLAALDPIVEAAQSPDGRRLYLVTRALTVVVVDTEKRAIIQEAQLGDLTSEAGEIFPGQIALSPDGTRLAIGLNSEGREDNRPRPGSTEVRLFATDSWREVGRVTANPSINVPELAIDVAGNIYGIHQSTHQESTVVRLDPTTGDADVVVSKHDGTIQHIVTAARASRATPTATPTTAAAGESDPMDALSALQAAAGFQLYAPTWLPDGVELEPLQPPMLQSGFVSAHVNFRDATGQRVLMITQASPFQAGPDTMPDAEWINSVEQEIAGKPGRIYETEARIKIWWQEGETAISLESSGAGPTNAAPALSREQLITIAESMTLVPPQTQDVTLPPGATIQSEDQAVAHAVKMLFGVLDPPSGIARLTTLAEPLALGMPELAGADPTTPVWRVEFDTASLNPECPGSATSECSHGETVIILDALTGELLSWHGAYGDWEVPPVKPPDSDVPTAGACAGPGAPEAVVTIAVNGDTPSPRCTIVTPSQRLRVVNTTDQTVEVQIGKFAAAILPGEAHTFDAPFGTYLAPGVHTVRTSAYSGGVELWLQENPVPIPPPVPPPGAEPTALPADRAIYPIVDGDTAWLLGGSQDGEWLDPQSTAALLTGNERYRFVTQDGEQGTAMGQLEPAVEHGICSDLRRVALTPGPTADNSLAVAGAWDPLPRQPTEVSTESEVYRQVIARLLQKEGISQPDVRLTRVLRIDLEGDGTDEVLISARNYAAGQPLGELRAGDYSLVVLRKVRGDTVEMRVLASAVHLQDDSPQNLAEYTIAGLLDLNGDSVLEIVLDERYWEQSSTRVYDASGQVTVVGASCGV